ncbi:hypothetical protein Xsto_03936 [Xenorhabdus stockiae]|uniref:Uncharacterized protein n=1 Tax=Xenorhabdus stockiae TaxID=351614 RepID=A0A2D0KAZ5_9GAMM|nr:hypothetical protein [Xenorhabdus stockiae]PHM60505.1 hypothetical protein Xsto_03936 [Xenorhabdus stockiae]
MGFDIENELRRAVEQKRDFDLRVQEAHRVSASAVQRALEDVADMAVDTIETIGLGMRRELYYRVSPYFEGYEDVHDKIKEEDKRMNLNLAELKNNANFIKRMIELYVKEVFDGNDEEAIKRIFAIMIKLTAKYSTAQSVKTGITMVISEAIYLNVIRSVVVKRAAKMTINALLTLTQSYGYVEKASMAADNLKIICPKLYWIFYYNKLEMLYFIIESKLEPAIYILNTTTPSERKGSSYEEQVARVLADIINN